MDDTPLDHVDAFRKIESRLDTIEELLKMQLMASVLENGGRLLQSYDEGNLTQEERDILEKIGVKSFSTYEMGRIRLIFIPVVERVAVANIRKIHTELLGHLVNTAPVFSIPKLTAAQRQILIRERISFFEHDVEIHIYLN